jgi:DNA-binding MarR family transcriptional regulator
MSKSSNQSHATGDLSNITTYQAGVVQASAHRNLQKLCDEFLRPYGITKMQWLIIGTVLDAGKSGMRLTDLAEIVGTTLSYLTTAVNLLESKDILIRSISKGDNRSKTIRLNPKFTPISSQIESELRDKLRETIYADIDPDEFRTYMKILFRLGAIRIDDKSQLHP